MKKVIFTIITLILLLLSCNNRIGKYAKEPLPGNFSYHIVKDESSVSLEKNQLTVWINQKLTEEQIATLAETIFNSKPRQRRFYIFYLLSEKPSDFYWATSHFDPELDIQILGSSPQQDKKMSKISNAIIDGTVVGKWKEDKYTSSSYIIYKKNGKIFMKIIFSDGQTSEDELSEKKMSNGIRYNYKYGGYGNEYFILNSNRELEFYNEKNKKFTTAYKN